ncbi:GNAT family N-acetyltransferase [Stenotrophomonas sp.]|uniref:GNAT family N-acetyltransferase n=1 Tax=Stenotrophomonas sp. TaxID=69392 RepID=UPI0028AA632E|nr:GNAT family N-acetyltransferase [Stenotrophomonas sp.]
MLRDRTRVLIRPITAADRDIERAFIEGLSPQARRFRFLGQICSPSEQLLTQLTVLDDTHQVAFAAVISDASREQLIGVSRYSTNASGDACECAVTVADEWQGRGLGVILMNHLIAIARSRGIKRMYSIDDARNTHMRELAKHLGFSSRVDPEDHRQVIHELPLDPGT